jgi:hypothetical protein
MEKNNVIIKEGTNDKSVAVQKAYEFAKKMEAELTAKGEFPSFTHKDKEGKTYEAPAQIMISSFTSKDGAEKAQLEVRDGLYTVRMAMDEKGGIYGLKASGYAPTKKSFYDIAIENIASKSAGLKTLVDYANAGKGEFAPKEAFNAYVELKKAVNASTPKLESGKNAIYVTDIKTESFTTERGTFKACEFSIKGREDEEVRVRINHKGEFLKAELVHFNGKGETPTYTVLSSENITTAMSDKTLADVALNAIGTLPQREEHSKDAPEPEMPEEGFEADDPEM